MSKVKGFIVIDELVDNTPNTIAQFGELSSVSETYSKEKGFYTSTTYPDVMLKSFTCVNDEGEKITLPSGTADAILAVAQLVYELYRDDQVPGTIGGLLDYIEQELNENEAYVGLDAGEKVVDVDDANKWFPDHITFTHTSGGDVFETTIWFADEKFKLQYDEFEIVAIPPVNLHVDELNGTPTAVATLVNALKPDVVLDKIETAKDGYSPTHTRTYNLTWNDPNNQGSQIQTPWIILVYGAAGNSPEKIEEAIAAYIDSETELNPSVWQTIYPALYLSTEFYLIPFWDRIAIPGALEAHGIYSPIMRPGTLIDIAEAYAHGYSSAVVQNGLTVQTCMYKSIGFLAVGGQNNAEGKVRLNLRFPDYINVPTDSLDFNRMSQDTQGFINFLVDMLEIAEDVTPSDIVPAGFSKVTRGGKLYIAGRYVDTNFYMITKHSFTSNV